MRKGHKQQQFYKGGYSFNASTEVWKANKGEKGGGFYSHLLLHTKEVLSLSAILFSQLVCYTRSVETMRGDQEREHHNVNNKLVVN